MILKTPVAVFLLFLVFPRLPLVGPAAPAAASIPAIRRIDPPAGPGSMGPDVTSSWWRGWTRRAVEVEVRPGGSHLPSMR